MVYIKNIILFSFLIFISCDKDGTIVHNDPLIHQSSIDGRDYSDPMGDNKLSGDGCTSDNLCYSIDDVYFDFSSSDGFQVDFYKFNYAQIQEGAPHDINEDIFTLKSFNNTWLVGIPSTSVVENSDDQVLVYCLDEDDDGICEGGSDPAGDGYAFTTESIIDQVDDPAYCTGPNAPDQCDDIIKYIEGEISLSSTQLENIEELKWNDSQGKYKIDPIQSDQFSQSFLYSQPYEEIHLMSVIDAESYDIYGDLILVDQTENIYREYEIEELLANGDAVESYREATYYTQYSYLDPVDALISQENTDCNDNYQVDSIDEWVIFDGYYDSPSFEAWCLSSGGEFHFDSFALCNSYCEFPNDPGMPLINMEDFCWEYYTDNVTYNFEEDNRLTGNCYVSTNPNTKIQYSVDEQLYQLTFCDRGNNYYDPEEYFIDQYVDGMHGVNLNQGVEPFEDRNCNEKHDDAEIDLVPDIDWDAGDWSDDCGGYVSKRGGKAYCDRGNRIWDQAEEIHPACNDDEDEGTQGPYQLYKPYQCLFKLADKDDKIIVDYSNQSEPIALTSILPRAGFIDTGSDGCFDIFETGPPEKSCLCELIDCDPLIPSCEEYLTDLGLMNESDQDSDGNYLGDINKDGEITDIDIALAISQDGEMFSPYNYGECNNGYSGTKEDCCVHQGCKWENDNCVLDDLQECPINSFSWEQRLDPNCDNYNTLDPLCNTSTETEFDGIYHENEMTKQYINPALNSDQDLNYIISKDEYCELEDKSSYSPYYYDEPTIISRHLDYNDGDSEGGDEMKIIRHENHLKSYSAKTAIIKSRNTLKSHPVIDQLDFDNDQNLSQCYGLDNEEDCENNSELTWCSWNDNECSVDQVYAVNTYNAMIDNYNLVKTEFKNSEGSSDYDYMIFGQSDNHIIKMIHPYYHFGDSNEFPNDLDDFAVDQFWEAVNLQADTLIYSLDGNIINGQYFHSIYTEETDQAIYEVAKEYVVEDATAKLAYAVDDPQCALYLNENDCMGAEEFWCDWDADDNSCYTSIKQDQITDCLLVSRIIETTAMGTDMSFQLKSDTYFKPGYGIVKEDLFIHWDDYPWLESNFTPISSIEYITPSEESSSELMTSQGNIFFNYEVIDVEDFQNVEDFNYSSFKVTNTLGVQRLEYPINY